MFTDRIQIAKFEQKEGRKEMSYRILAIERILLRHPDGISTNKIIDILDNEYGIQTERKAVYSNIATLTYFMPIDVRRGGNRENIYFLQRRDKTI